MTFNEWWSNEWHNVYDVALQGELQPKDFVQIGWNAALQNQWRPIGSAPKDGSEIIVKNKISTFAASWVDKWWAIYDGREWHSLRGSDPTHWMPIPAAPEGEKMNQEYAKQHAFETRLLHSIGNNRGREIMADMGFKCIAVNIGNATSEIFEEMWRRECPECRGTGMYHLPGGYIPDLRKFECKRCNGTGYTEPYDLAIAFVRGNGKLWHVQLFSNKDDVDCGAIAYTFGGNGSVREAEFDCRELPFEI